MEQSLLSHPVLYLITVKRKQHGLSTETLWPTALWQTRQSVCESETFLCLWHDAVARDKTTDKSHREAKANLSLSYKTNKTGQTVHSFFCPSNNHPEINTASFWLMNMASFASICRSSLGAEKKIWHQIDWVLQTVRRRGHTKLSVPSFPSSVPLWQQLLIST